MRHLGVASPVDVIHQPLESFSTDSLEDFEPSLGECVVGRHVKPRRKKKKTRKLSRRERMAAWLEGFDEKRERRRIYREQFGARWSEAVKHAHEASLKKWQSMEEAA